MAFVFLQFRRQQTLVTQHRVVDKRYTAYPVALRDVAVALQVILTAHKVPHEVAPVHEVDLIAKEEPEVLAECRTIVGLLLAAVVVTHATAFYVCPLFVCPHMAALTRIHTREQHAELRHILVARLIACDDIMVFLAFFLRSRSILRVTFFLYGHAHVAFYTQLYRRIVGLAVEQRTIAVLLTVQVVFQAEHIVGAVLIHRRVGVRTNHQRRITAVAHQDHSYHHSRRMQPAPELAPFTFLLQPLTFLARVPNSPYQQRYYHHQTYPHTGVERTAQAVDKRQLKPADQRRQTGDNTVQNHQQHRTRSQEGIYQAFPTELIFAEVVHQSDGRYRQQVQQVDTYTQTHQVGNSYQPFVATLFVGLLVPL